MNYKILLQPHKTFRFEEQHDYLHSLFSKIFHSASRGTKKKKYSFFIERKKIYFKDKKYIVNLHTSDPLIDSLIQTELMKDSRICSIVEKDVKLSRYVQVYNLRYVINQAVNANWNLNIEDFSKKQLYVKKYGKELLQELIELQVSKQLGLVSENKSKNGEDCFNFIEDMMIINGRSESTTHFDVLLELKEGVDSMRVGRFMVSEGIGVNNSFGFGYCDFKEGIN